MGAGKSWSVLERLLATKAFVWASEYPEKGNGQKKAAFDAAVAAFYDKLVQDKLLETADWSHQDRSGSAIVQMYRKVKRESLMFEGQSLKAPLLTGVGTEASDKIQSIAPLLFCYMLQC
jgi:hypothetical protein